MSGRVLFIGGSQDGYRKPWPVMPDGLVRARYHAWQPPLDLAAAPWPPPLDRAAADMAIGVTTCDYNLVQLAGADGAVYTVAVEGHIKDPLVALIKGYHYHRHPQYRKRKFYP